MSLRPRPLVPAAARPSRGLRRGARASMGIVVVTVVLLFVLAPEEESSPSTPDAPTHAATVDARAPTVRPPRPATSTPASTTRPARSRAGEPPRPVRGRGSASPLDDFQRRALDALDAGHSVLVAAPTGSGKTLVAEYAIELALAARQEGLLHDAAEGALEPEVRRLRRASRHERGRPAHRRQLGQRRGAGRRDDDRSAPQHDLRRVTDPRRAPVRRPRRGALPPGPRTAGRCGRKSSSTSRPRSTSCACRRRCRTPRRWRPGSRPSAARRPRSSRSNARCVLHHRYLLGERGNDALQLLPTFAGEPDDLRPNPDVERLDRATPPAVRGRGPSGSRPPAGTRPGRDRRAARPPSELLPAIVFVFSRAGCEQAVEQCRAAGVRLTTSDEARADPRDRRSAHVDASPTTTSTSSATTPGSRASRPGSRRTTPGWCRR